MNDNLSAAFKLGCFILSIFWFLLPQPAVAQGQDLPCPNWSTVDLPDEGAPPLCPVGQTLNWMCYVGCGDDYRDTQQDICHDYKTEMYMCQLNYNQQNSKCDVKANKCYELARENGIKPSLCKTLYKKCTDSADLILEICTGSAGTGAEVGDMDAGNDYLNCKINCCQAEQ